MAILPQRGVRVARPATVCNQRKLLQYLATGVRADCTTRVSWRTQSHFSYTQSEITPRYDEVGALKFEVLTAMCELADTHTV